MSARFIPALLLLTLAACQTAPVRLPVPAFATESAAQAHCPGGRTVWVDEMGGTYHLKGEAWYGRLFGHGAYACETDAIRSPLLRHGHELSD